jgi:hypothetical protein
MLKEEISVVMDQFIDGFIGFRQVRDRDLLFPLFVRRRVEKTRSI